MLCGRCGASVPRGAVFCSRCGAQVGGSSDPRSMEQRRMAALEALDAGRDADGLHCPECGDERLHTVRHDAEENLFWSGASMFVGIASLIIVVIGGDTGLYVANLSTIALLAILVGVLLFVIARWRRRPSAFECLACGYRVP